MTEATEATALLAKAARARPLWSARSARRISSRILHLAAAAAVPLRARRIRRELHRNRPRTRRLQHRVGGAANAGRFSGRLAGRAYLLIVGLLSAPSPLRSPVWSIHSGCWWRCLRSPVSATPSTTRPITHCCRIMFRPIASARRFRCTLSPACSDRRWPRRVC